MGKSKPPVKMSVSERAKQFMPFAALKGLDEALKAKEKIKVDKKEVPDDIAQLIDSTLKTVKCGDIVNVVYYENGEYIKLHGMVADIDGKRRILRVVSKAIPFDDIYEINNP